MSARPKPPHLQLVPAQPPRRPGPMQLAQEFIGAAKAHPEIAAQILGTAAQTFAGLANQQRDVGLGRQLQAIAQEFSGAARQASRDDFREILAETAEALEESASDIDVAAIRDQIHEAGASGSGSHVSIAPKTFKAGSTVLGRQTTIKYNPTEAEKENGIQQIGPLLYWLGDKEESAAFTVDINLVSTPHKDPTLSPSFPAVARSYAEITYGSDGNRTTVVCDAGYGVRMTGVGNYCSVLVGMDAPIEGTNGAIISFGASLGMFAAPSQAPVIRTRYLDLIGDDTTSDLIERPAKASQLLWPQTNATAGSFGLAFYGATGTNELLYVVKIPVGTVSITPIPLTADVAFVAVINKTGDIASFRLPFELSM